MATRRFETIDQQLQVMRLLIESIEKATAAA
jgi:hypothetical protein